MLDTTKLDELVRRERAKVTNAFLKAAKNARNEREFQTAATQIIEDFARTAQIDLPVREEYTLFNGRADAVYNRFIIEYERPGSLRDANSLGHNQHAIGQVKEYLNRLVRRERHKAERLAGVVFNGDFYIWVRQRKGTWHIDQPIKVQPTSTERFLRTICSLSTERALIPENLVEDFGENTNISRQVVLALYERLTDNPPRRAEVLFKQWSQQFSEVCDYDQASKVNVAAQARAYGIKGGKIDPFRFFFCIHTYYAYLIKLLAVQIVHFYFMPKLGTDLRQAAAKSSDDLRKYLSTMEDGGIFRQLGINNLMEADFFGWYLDVWCEVIEAATREVINTLGNYSADTLDIDPDSSRDLLKHLYQNLMPKTLRHNLGEYYTPDWLAERTLGLLDGVKEETLRESKEGAKATRFHVYRGDPKKRLLDPACGSGTFLVMAIRRIKEYAWRNAIPEREVLQLILRNVVGFDLNPLAVVSARTNYLLALGDLLQHRGEKEIDIPIYLCDSIKTPSEGGEMWEKGICSFDTSVGPFSVPSSMVEAQKIDALSNLLEESVKIDRNTAEFLAKARQAFGLSAAEHERDLRVLGELYEDLSRLKREGINGIWARIIKNAFAPLFAGRFDLVAGNPPWINWEHLPEQYRQSIAPLWQRYDLFRHAGMKARTGAAKDDISILMFFVAADQYLVRSGRIAFVITQTIFKSSGGGEGFRRLRFGKNGAQLAVLWVDDWSNLKPFEGAANRTAVVLAARDRATRYPVGYGVWRKRSARSRLPEDAPIEVILNESCRLSSWNAEPIDNNRHDSPWISGRGKCLRAIKKMIGQSHYRAREGTNTGGANGAMWVEVIDRRSKNLWLVANQGEIGKRKVDSIEGAVESSLLHPLLRGQDLARWSAKPSLDLLLPQDPSDPAKPIPLAEMKAAYPKAFLFISHFREALLSRKSNVVQGLMANGEFYAMFGVGPYSFAPYKCVWREVSNDMNAAVVSREDEEPGRIVVPDHTVVSIGTTTEDEAHFVCAMMNSSIAAFIVRGYVTLHPSPHVMNYISIPGFQSKNEAHRCLVRVSKAAHAAVASGATDDLPELEADVDQVATQVWGLSVSELKDIEKSLEELRNWRQHNP